MSEQIFPTAQISSSHDQVAALDLTSSLQDLTSAKGDYDDALSAWEGAGSLEHGSEYAAKLAAEAALSDARDSAASARAQKADRIADVIRVYINSQTQGVPDGVVGVARMLALELLPNGTPDELGL